MALAEILARKREDVAARMRERPLEAFRGSLAPSDRSLAAALTLHPRTAFILECKKASPSAGAIRPDLDVREAAAAYLGYASAISVLTDGPYFGGSFEDLRAVRGHVHQPVLCKDFVIDPYQVYEARFHGADAVLLMLNVLDDQQYERCAAAVRELGMEALTEVHDEDEMARAARLGSRIIGINNRNLRTLEVDLSVTERLAPLRPPGALLVCESGISSHADVVRLRPQVDAFLVGSVLMRAPDVRAAVRQLMFGRVKVCGLTRDRDLDLADQFATWAGLILASESPRCVTPEHARALRTRSALNLRWAGVFVNESPHRVAELAAELSLDAVQLHGEESTDEMRELRRMLPDECEIWKAVRVREHIPGVEAADRILLDTWSARSRGGTGRAFDWTVIDVLHARGRYILSGGLDASCAPAADALGLWALDVNSGIEESPGVKSAGKVAEFFHALQGRLEKPS